MSFAVNILWIALGLGSLGIARSFGRTGNRISAVGLALFGAGALAMGIFL